MKASETVIYLMLFSLVATGGLFFIENVYKQYDATFELPDGTNFSYIGGLNATTAEIKNGSVGTEMELGDRGWISGGLETLKKVFDTLPFFSSMIGSLIGMVAVPLGIDQDVLMLAFMSIITIAISAIILRSVFKWDI